VAEVGLQTDVQESREGQDLVDGGVTGGVVQASGDEDVLDGLEQLHGEEEEDAGRQLNVVGAGVDPPRREQADACEAQTHLASETHLSYL
jgi:hypothetical protein